MSLSRFLYLAARASRDGEAVGKSLATGSPRPIANRLINRAIGRFILAPLGRLLWRR